MSRNAIERFASTISGQPLGLAKYPPEPWADIIQCFENVRRKAKQSGGDARFGWMFQHKAPQATPGPGYLIDIHHAVWRAPNGHLFDVTPFHPDPRNHPIAVRGGTLFLLDDLARPVTRGRLNGPRPTKFFALNDDAWLVSYEEEQNHCRDLYAAGET